MQYALLIYEPPEAFESRGDQPDAKYIGAWRTFYQSMVDAGVYAGGNPLDPPSTGATVRVRNGERQSYDGPYAETKEFLGGIVLIEADSFAAAVEWASRCPVAALGAVEVRPIANRIHNRITETEEP